MNNLFLIDLNKIVYIIGSKNWGNDLKISFENNIKYKIHNYKIYTKEYFDLEINNNDSFFNNYFYEDRNINPFRKFGIFNINWVSKYQKEMPSFIIFTIDLKDSNIDSFIDNFKIIYQNDTNNILNLLKKNKIKIIFILYNNEEKSELIKNQLKEKLKINVNNILDSNDPNLFELIFNLLSKKTVEFYKFKIEKLKYRNNKIINEGLSIFKKYLIKNHLKIFLFYKILNNTKKINETINIIVKKIDDLIDIWKKDINKKENYNKEDYKLYIIDNLYTFQQINEVNLIKHNFFIFEIYQDINNKNININEFIFNIYGYLSTWEKIFNYKDLNYLNYSLKINYIFLFLEYSIHNEYNLIKNSIYLSNYISNLFNLLVKLSINRFNDFKKNDNNYENNKQLIKSNFYGIFLDEIYFDNDKEYFNNNFSILDKLIKVETNTDDYEKILNLIQKFLDSKLNNKNNSNNSLSTNFIILKNLFIKKNKKFLELDNYLNWSNIKTKILKCNVWYDFWDNKKIFINKLNLIFEFNKEKSLQSQIINDINDLKSIVKEKINYELKLTNKEYSSKIYKLFSNYYYQLDEEIIIDSYIKINKIIKELCSTMIINFENNQQIILNLSEFEDNHIKFNRKIKNQSKFKDIIFTMNNDNFEINIKTLNKINDNSIVKCIKNSSQNYLDFKVIINNYIYHNEKTQMKIEINKLVNSNIKLKLINLEVVFNNINPKELSNTYKSIIFYNNNEKSNILNINLEIIDKKTISVDTYIKFKILKEFGFDIYFILNYQIILNDGETFNYIKKFNKKIIFSYPFYINQKIRDTSNIIYQNKNYQTLHLINKNFTYAINIKSNNEFIIKSIDLIRNSKFIYIDSNFKENDIELLNQESINYCFNFKSKNKIKNESIGEIKILYKRINTDKINSMKFNLNNLEIIDFPISINVYFQENIEYGNKTKFIINLTNKTNKKIDISYTLVYWENDYFIGGWVNSKVKLDEKQNINLNYFLIPLRYGILHYPKIKLTLKDTNELYNINLFNNIIVEK